MRLCLSPDRIDLWFVFPDDVHDVGLLAQYRSLLTDAERRQEDRFYFADDRKRYRLTRALVRTVLSRYWAIEPEAWRFTTNAFGCPSVASEHAAAGLTSFNLSHTSGLIMLGVTGRRRLGVDAENLRARNVALDVADHFFSASEVQALRALPLADQPARFFDYWTLKEAFVKARQQGLSIPLDRFSFRFPGRNAIGVSFDPELNDNPARWLFWQVRPSSNCVTAVCAERSDERIPQVTMRRYIPLAAERPLVCPILRQSH